MGSAAWLQFDFSTNWKNNSLEMITRMALSNFSLNEDNSRDGWISMVTRTAVYNPIHRGFERGFWFLLIRGIMYNLDFF